LSILPVNGFDGIDAAHSNFGDPPDTVAAAGPSSVVEIVNNSVAIYNKTTGALITPITSSLSFFNLPSQTYITDPVVIYDEITGRFAVGVVDGDDTRFEFAVSKTSNPQTLGPADWTLASYNANDGSNPFPDFPKIGYNADGFVVSYNMYGPSGSTIAFLHVSTLSIKNDLSSPGIQVVPGGPANATLAPATMHGASPGDPMWFVEEDGVTNSGKDVLIVKMTNPFSSSPSFSFSPVSVTPYSFLNREALQPGGSLNTGGIGTRFYFSALRNVGETSHLVAAQTVADATGVNRVHWYDVNVGGATPSLIQQGEINQGADVDTFLPSIDMAPDGSIGMTFSQSSSAAPSGYLSMYVTGRAAGDPAGTMQTPVLVKQGTASSILVPSKTTRGSATTVSPASTRPTARSGRRTNTGNPTATSIMVRGSSTSRSTASRRPLSSCPASPPGSTGCPSISSRTPRGTAAS
jgi:hypothetical protein